MSRIAPCLLFVLVIAVGLGHAQAEKSVEPAEPSGEPAAAPQPESSVTTHEVRIGGETVRYTATAGTLILRGDKDRPVARFGYTAYVRDGSGSAARRPITFAFNGGPGSSSIWLHMGILGPRRAVVTDGDFSPPGPYERVNNEYSILDVSDLVMLDPVGTGYSQPVGDAEGKDFWGVDQDIKSVAAFIKQYTTDNDRWLSPKYILGESYGAMRAAGVVYALQNRHSMNFNGVVLVSPFLDFVAGGDGIGIDLPHVLYLPTLAASAWYHDALTNKPSDLRAFLDEVARFAYDEYAPALLRGNGLGDDERRAIAAKLAGYTGVSAEYWLRADLRVSHFQFLQELLRGRNQVTGRIDSRFIGPNVNPLAEGMDYDPMLTAIGAPFVATFLDYYHGELEFGRDMDYAVMGQLDGEWDWTHESPDRGFWSSPVPNTAVDLARAMTENPHLEVLIQQGYFDVATPHLATEYVVDHMNLQPPLRDHIKIEYYDAGHMMYLHPPSMEKYKEDLARFIERTHRP
jgi:carboxypeptidase C (cathepsin A)